MHFKKTLFLLFGRLCTFAVDAAGTYLKIGKIFKDSAVSDVNPLQTFTAGAKYFEDIIAATNFNLLCERIHGDTGRLQLEALDILGGTSRLLLEALDILAL